MWLITNFSVVEKPSARGAEILTIRAQVRGDLEALREQFLPELGEIREGEGTDYRYRAPVPRSALARAAAKIVECIDYSNFNSSPQPQISRTSCPCGSEIGSTRKAVRS